ncbi:Rv2175c family DNA-binding protein [Corynebacterium caspium]|uniref:Rv2175c family DNA-binding protein n=1 Tax=Corynebacterium caspium TaxID=234828 RepID=UPI0009FEBA54|nr:Rv2175c family DNA-binding protein [Corynebacterium caspium]WKD58981.1 DNA-binding protein [Corynebacterium caspium DSM 44850]
MAPVTNLDPKPFEFPADESLMTLPAAAERLEVPITRLMDMLNAGTIIAVDTPEGRRIPELFFGRRRTFAKRVLGVISLLHDGGYSDSEIIKFLFTPDDSLPGRPIDALHGHLAREVLRRAQAMMF